MRVEALHLRDYRSYEAATLRLGSSITVLHGPNGAGKTNLLEALYVGCTSISCRTRADRELVRHGAPVARVELRATDPAGEHELSVGIAPGQSKRVQADGATIERLTETERRPLASVFLPDRVELVTGAPALRRSHLDAFVSALWPARTATRRAYVSALAQRNALLGRVRRGYAAAGDLAAWDATLATTGIALMGDRAAAVARIEERFTEISGLLGLEGGAEVVYRPASRAETPDELRAELADRVDPDLERGFTGHGPHRDDMRFRRAGRDLRTYGSRGQQRLGLLALLLAERDAITDLRGAPPLMLLDDVMGELDADRRGRLVDLLAGSGQSVITTTDADHVPAGGHDIAVVAVPGDVTGTLGARTAAERAVAA
jgi:DNA replication and repair protein RecF